MSGVFITLEGAEGSGKSTQTRKIVEYLNGENKPVMQLREPGGIKISESIRQILLDTENVSMCDECETLLYMAARAQLISEKIKPQLEQGQIIICDRFLDSTIAYQGYGNGVDVKMIETLGHFATQSLSPQLTLLFDIDPEEGLSRTDPSKDRIESRELDYHKRVREGYLSLAKEHPDRIKVISVDAPEDVIFDRIRPLIDQVVS